MQCVKPFGIAGVAALILAGSMLSAATAEEEGPGRFRRPMRAIPRTGCAAGRSARTPLRFPSCRVTR